MKAARASLYTHIIVYDTDRNGKRVKESKRRLPRHLLGIPCACPACEQARAEEAAANAS